jgi:hypothetical protein
MYTMLATPSSASPRSLSRTIRKLATDFLTPRVSSALESAADELKAQSSHHDRFDPTGNEPDAEVIETTRRDLATLREMISKSPGRISDALGDDIEACLLFGDASGTANAAPAKGKRRQLRRSEGLEVALLSDEELELSVMVSTVGSRFERRTREHLDKAIATVAAACGETRAELLRGLIGVFPLIDRFSTLIRAVPLSVASRAKIMNSFQFHVLDELERFYEPLAKALQVERPDRPPPPPKAAAPLEPTPGPMTDTGMSVAGPAGIHTGAADGCGYRPVSMQDWIQLLHQAAAAGFAGTGVPGAAATTGSPLAAGSRGSGTSLNSYLSQIPVHSVTNALLPAGAAEAGGRSGMGGFTSRGALYDQVVHAVQTECGITPDSVEGIDLDVLRLVSLFFETILGNEDLCPALRHLVGRLQLPVLRIALADGSFFDRDDHIARRLIETICQIGIGWSSDMVWVERSPAYKEVSTLVDRILDHPAPDAELFESVLQDMLNTQAARREKAARAETRVVDLEVGRSRLKAAKLLVQDELNHCLRRHQSVAALREFMAESWSRVLIFVCLRHGDSSEEWQAAVGLCDELARMFEPAVSRDEAEARLGEVPSLLERLESLMVEAGLTSSHIDQSIAELYQELDRIREIDDDWFASGGEMVIESEDVLGPITLIPPPAMPEVEQSASAESLDQIHPGTWVRVRESTDSSEFHQVKVAARVAETREILLVDERGARWGVWQEAEFAQAMNQGRIVLVDHDLIVRNTLDAMIAALTVATTTEGIPRASAY